MSDANTIGKELMAKELMRHTNGKNQCLPDPDDQPQGKNLSQRISESF